MTELPDLTGLTSKQAANDNLAHRPVHGLAIYRHGKYIILDEATNHRPAVIK